MMADGHVYQTPDMSVGTRQAPSEGSVNSLILIVEDESEIANILSSYLEREGFRTVSCGDGRTATELHSSLRPDLVLLDVHLPRLGGWDVLAELRRRGLTPVIMLTALDQDIDKLQALRMGADDYVVKPFNPVEVVARVWAVLRRSSRAESGVLRAGPIEVALENHIVSVAEGASVSHPSLTLTEFRLLAHMARSPMRVFSRSELVDACLAGDETLERTVDSHLSKLRRKLEVAGAHGVLRNVRGVGYRLAAVA